MIFKLQYRYLGVSPPAFRVFPLVFLNGNTTFATMKRLVYLLRQRLYMETKELIGKVVLCIIVFVCCGVSLSAQNIVGKWKLSKASSTLQQLPSYSYKNGYVKFKKDGTFLVKAHMMYPRGHSVAYSSDYKNRSISVKIKGTYIISNGRITSFVRNEDVVCNINTGQMFPDIEESHSLRGFDHQQTIYYGAENVASAQETIIQKTVYPYWIWKEETVSVTDSQLVISDKVIFKK